MATYEAVTYGSPDGAHVGVSSTAKIGFWGATPAVQQSAATTQTAVTTTASISSSITTSWGYSTSNQANDIVTQLNAAQTDIRALRDALRTVGILA